MRNILLGMAVLFLSGCAGSARFSHPEGQQRVQNHQRVAILPFKVSFSEVYKQAMREGQVPWPEQERRAGIDLQRTAFEYLAKRANKKKYSITVQDYKSTNRTLEQMGISYSELLIMDKGQLAQDLGVDAVVFARSEVAFDVHRFSMGMNGIETTMALYDASLGAEVWKQTTREYIRSRFDSPQELGKKSISGLINSLPYKSVK
jgi:hypothetical protein